MEQLILRWENAFGRGGEHRHLFYTCRQRVFKTSQVRRQGAIGHTGLALDLREHLGGTGHLRHPLGRDETADFDVAQAGGAQGIHQAHLVGDADGLCFILQPVTGADFDQAYKGGEGHGD